MSNNNLDSRVINFLIGPISGIIEVTCTHPLDRIKTEMQKLDLIDSKHKHSSIKHAIKNIYENKGYKGYKGYNGFYSGYIPRLVGIMPMRLVYWGTIKTMNDIVEHKSKLIQVFAPGIVTGVAQTCIDNPIEVIKIKLMTGMQTISYNDMIKNMYKGFTACLLRNIIFAIPTSYSIKTYGKDHPFTAGAIGGLFGSIFSQPLDVVKTEMQRYKVKNSYVSLSTLETFKEIIKKDPKNLMTGTVMRSSLAIFNMGIGMLAYSHIHSFVSDIWNSEVV